MVIALVTNYYINSLEKENLVQNIKSEPDNLKLSYDNSIVTPQYYNYNAKKQRFFIRADSAHKKRELVDLERVSGSIEVLNGMRLDYLAQYGTINIATKQVALNGSISLKTNDVGELYATDLLINYGQHNISSNTKIKIVYKNIDLTAQSFNTNEKRIISFSGPIKLQIKS